VTARGRYRRRSAKRGAASAVLPVVSLLLTLPAAGLLTADTVLHRTDSAGADQLVASPVASEHDAYTSPERVGPGRIVIETVGVSAEVETVGLATDGTLALPTDTDTVGWFTGSSRPGEIGPAVMVGHVDSLDGLAVFGRLAGLNAGDLVTVDNADGTTVSFVVSSVTRYPKESFPSDAVYGPTPDAELRLITCGGRYDWDTGYADNVVVLARTAGV
jgi:Sortase domain